MRRLILVALLAAAATTLVFAKAAERTTGTTWDVDSSPFRVTIHSGSHTLLQQQRGARLRYQLADGTQHALTKTMSKSGNTYTVATDEKGRTAKVVIVRRPHGVRMSVQLTPARGVSQVYDAFSSSAHEHFMGSGERGAFIDLRGEVMPIKVSYKCAEAPAPYFVSSNGYGLRLVTDAVAGLAFPRSSGGGGCNFGDTAPCTFPALKETVEVCVKGARLIEDVYAGDPETVQGAYLDDVGRAAVPPLSQYALIKWRDEVTGPADLYDDVRRLRAAKVPVGWVILDNPWETCAGTFQWDRERIPDPAQLVRNLRAQNVRLMLWVSPDVYCPEKSGYDNSQLIPTPVAPELNLSKPAVVRELKRRLKRVLSVGVAGVKGDRADEGDLEPLSSTLHNRYPLLFTEAVVSVLRELRGNDFATIFRAASPTSPTVAHGFWNGDQPGIFIGLERAILQGETAGLAGLTVWGSDIGGYSSADLTPEVFARWTQFGAVSPVMEVGGTGPNATPWQLGPEAMSALRRSADLHYALVPLFDSLVRQGRLVLRPLAYGFPHDEASWKADYEFLVGPDLLAAPVIGPGTGPQVYLPPGRWVDLHTGATVQGGRVFMRPTPLDELPLYARDGAVVPFNLRTAKHPLWALGELSHPGRAGFLATSRAMLHLRGQPAHVQVFVPTDARPMRVTVGGRSVPFTWEDRPMQGAVLRLHGPVIEGRIVLRTS